MLRWEHTWAFYLLAIVPLLVVLYIVFKSRRKKSLRKFASPQLMKRLARDLPMHKHEVKFVFILLAFVALTTAIANPELGSKLEEVKREGIDIMIALDLSRSMNATDVSPSRLEKAKVFINKLLSELQGDRIGLVIFAGNAYVQMPITTDYSAATLFLESISSEIVPRQGTAIGESIRLSLESFDKENETNRAIVIISDGENHEGDALEAAKEARAAGVLVYSVGVGTAKGAPVPLTKHGVRYDFQRDKDGNIITSKMYAEMLREVAEAGGGTYFSLDNTRETAQLLNDDLLKLEKKEMESRVFTDYEDHFQLFLIICLALLLLDWLITYKRNQWLKKMDLFEH
ncbi:VWA domain-containing protein [bacterium]|nr:VWA domain-containing protein [bacterium]